jgi:hypothetical protein
MFDSPGAITFPVKIVPNTLSTKLTVNGVSPVLVVLYVYVTDVPFSTFVELGVLVSEIAGCITVTVAVAVAFAVAPVEVVPQAIAMFVVF